MGKRFFRNIHYYNLVSLQASESGIINRAVRVNEESEASQAIQTLLEREL